MYNTQQQRLHFTVHQIFKLNYTNSKNCALLKLERMHVFNTEYKAEGSTNTKLGEAYHPGQPLLWRPEALCIPRSVWSPSTFSSTGMLSLWNPLGSPALWCKYSLPSTPEVSPLDPWLLPRPSVLTTFWWVRLQVMKLHLLIPYDPHKNLKKLNNSKYALYGRILLSMKYYRPR